MVFTNTDRVEEVAGDEDEVDNLQQLLTLLQVWKTKKRRSVKPLKSNQEKLP